MIGTYGYKNVYLISTNKQINKPNKSNERTDCCSKIETRDFHAIIYYILHFLCVKLEKNELFSLLKKYFIFDKKNQATHDSTKRKILVFYCSNCIRIECKETIDNFIILSSVCARLQLVDTVVMIASFVHR